jgi:hypothetical protein
VSASVSLGFAFSVFVCGTIDPSALVSFVVFLPFQIYSLDVILFSSIFQLNCFQIRVIARPVWVAIFVVPSISFIQLVDVALAYLAMPALIFLIGSSAIDAQRFFKINGHWVLCQLPIDIGHFMVQ